MHIDEYLTSIHPKHNCLTPYTCVFHNFSLLLYVVGPSSHIKLSCVIRTVDSQLKSTSIPFFIDKRLVNDDDFTGDSCEYPLYFLNRH